MFNSSSRQIATAAVGVTLAVCLGLYVARGPAHPAERMAPSAIERALVGTDSQEPRASELPTLDTVLLMSDDDLETIDVATLNLLCASNLPGADSVDIQRCLKVLDDWSDRVRSETEKYLPRFRDKSEDFIRSEAEFRMAMLITVLQQDFQVRYNSHQTSQIAFTEPNDLFIHGMVTGNKGGTCIAMPVLCAAVARRLHYPVRIALCKGHVFCRWDTPEERFNIECTGIGYKRRDDDHFLRWPHPIGKEEQRLGQYLKSLSPREELALFLATRGHYLLDKGFGAEAIVAYSQAHRLHPELADYIVFLTDAARQAMPSLTTSTE